MIRVPVGSLKGKKQGNKQEYDIQEHAHFDGVGAEDELMPITFHVKLLKLPHEINVQVSNLHTEVRSVCSRCLIPFTLAVDIPHAEREFIIDLPEEDLEASEDVFYVDSSTNSVLLDEMLREEILLHFPAIPLCSEGCKGLCDQCGKNRNETPCACIQPDTAKTSPFKFLNH